MRHADSLGFFANPGEEPILDVQKRPDVSVVHLTSVPPWIDDPGKALEVHQRFKKAALGNKDAVHIRQASDVPVQAPHTGVLFGMQHTPAGTTLGDVQMLADAGVQFMSLAYKGPTEYGSGFSEDGPLTTLGKYLLDWMAMCGMTLDISHASNRTAIDALEHIRKEELPMIPLASHSGVREVHDHPRNVSPEVLLLLNELNGYIGIPLITFYICAEADPAHFDAHFDRHLLYHVASACTMAGLENVGIGSDCVHRNMTMDEAGRQFDKMKQALGTDDGAFGAYFPDRPESVITGGSRLLALKERVIADGFQSLQKAEAICGGNFLAYLKRALPR